MIKDTEYRSLCNIFEEFRRKTNAHNVRTLFTHLSHTTGRLSEYAYTKASIYSVIQHGRSLEKLEQRLEKLVTSIESREGVPISKILQERADVNSDLEDWLENPVEPQR